MNFYKRFMGDYAKDTAHLSLAEHGAYTLLLDHYYATEAPLPADYQALYRICRAFDKKEQQAVRSIADAYFPVVDGARENKRATRQLDDDSKRVETARENGRKGGRPKKQTQTEPKNNPMGFDSETQEEPKENPGETQAKPNTKAHHSQTIKEENTLSGRPDDSPQNPDKKTAAKDVLDYLNRKTKRAYRSVPANLNLIEARIRDGTSIDQLKTIIDAKTAQWLDDPKMVDYLRPSTLFNRTKCEQYLGQIQSGSGNGGLEYDV